MSEVLCDCQYCGYGLTIEHVGGDCPRCGEEAEVHVACEHCGYEPDDDALIHGVANGHCPKCGGDWGDDDSDDDEDVCPECGIELDDRDEEEGHCGECGAIL